VKIEPEEVKVPMTEEAPEVSVKLEDSSNNTRQLRRRKINLSKLKVGRKQIWTSGGLCDEFFCHNVSGNHVFYIKNLKIISVLRIRIRIRIWIHRFLGHPDPDPSIIKPNLDFYYFVTSF
jgi:hypothetical protein